MLQEQDVLNALSNVQDPDLHRDIVSLGFVKKVDIDAGRVSVVVELTTPACPVKEQLRQQCVDQIKALPGVSEVFVQMTAQVRGAPQTQTGTQDAPAPVLAGVKNVFAVASGKGGVGKSTVAVNLAAALAKTGASVGLMDADVYGPSVARMLGGQGEPRGNAQGLLVPFDAHGFKFVSMGMLITDDAPVIWRGPMASSLINQFLTQVDWGELDYLVIDLPPGTGDVQLTLTQTARLSGAIIVTTPQEVATAVSMRGLKMFGTVNVPVFGVVENMAYFICDKCNERHDIFRPKGGKRASEQWNVPLLGEIPIEPSLASLGDEGTPIVIGLPDSDTAKAFSQLAEKVAAALSTQSMTQSEFDAPTSITADGDRLEIQWSDGHAGSHDFRRLRYQCTCAGCQDEHTGVRTIAMDDIDPEVRPNKIEQSGRYALKITWSDGHSTGLYTFDRLRKLCECEACASRKRD